jgi:hypothetical protein
MKHSTLAFLPKAVFLAFLLLLSADAVAQCTYYPVSAGSVPPVTFSGSGGSLQSYGCAPIDPTYWVAGNGPTMTISFSTPQSFPAIRVWGMNTDDVASVQVNAVPYPLNAVSAYEVPKVVCGISPGPLGVVFVGGNFAGGNTNGQGNYSYSDIVLATGGVNSITINALSGAGWGIAGVVISCVLPLPDPSGPPTTPESPEGEFSVWPNPTDGFLQMEFPSEFVPALGIIYNCDGREITRILHPADPFTLDLSDYPPGLYYLKVRDNDGRIFGKKIRKL